ncbi:peptidylprolyl isomerase [Candidatus Woesearchaeota archaeon CG10_big_fil_rev_8_21_14_0_10_32_24]|nr:MAG: peptidylprolyl isomerase [Candidatus Woesearchaeota archaeon CG10_big_fil_rev_8_21_14_0_10_32_24]
MEKVQKNDFIEITYTGRLEDGTIFDTTDEKIAHEAKIPHTHNKLKPAVICVGEKQLLSGLDNGLEGQEIGKEFSLTLQPEDAFGKRDVKNIEMMPIATFKEHKMVPQPGLQFDADGRRGVITKVSGGRVIVNYNHPLAGKKVIYTCMINKKITDIKEQIQSFLEKTLKMGKEYIPISINDGNAIVELPLQLPPQFISVLAEKLKALTKVDVEFKVKEDK